MAKSEIILQDLAKVDPPTCPGCAYGKAHKKQWRHKGVANLKDLKPTTFHGQVVSVDKLASSTLWFFPCHHGIPIIKRYKGVTIFIDHFLILSMFT